MNGRKIRASGQFSERRKFRKECEATQLQADGYVVERGGHPNGAYFAFIGNHQEHEKTVGRIFAENGFSFTLDREGNEKVRINGRLYTLPSSDGHVEGFSHEIYGFEKAPSPQKVSDAIKHSRKVFEADRKRTLQSDIAISIADKGSDCNLWQIEEGVKEYIRQFTNGEAQAKPLLYLHVDETSRSIYRWSIKPKG